MPQVAINILGWNHDPHEVDACIEAALAQDHEDFEVTFSDNGSSNGLYAHVTRKYHGRPKFRAVDNGTNLGFAGGHNVFIHNTDAEFVVVLNPDALLHTAFLKKILPAFRDQRVAAATGKMLKLSGETTLIDGTGITMNIARAAHERGQHRPDIGQFDSSSEVFGVSGTAGVYRRSALREASLGSTEYFDTDFFAYCEDVDLAWRLRLLGYKASYVPDAVVHHKRVVQRSVGLLRNPVQFVRMHRTHSGRRRLGWRNHLFCILKNDYGVTFFVAMPFIAVRELAKIFYMAVFEPRSLSEVKHVLALTPKMWRKRKLIQQNRKVSSDEVQRWFRAAMCVPYAEQRPIDHRDGHDRSQSWRKEGRVS